MSLGDVLGLLKYWQDNPPVHVILAARYLDRSGTASSRRQQPQPQSEEEIHADMMAVASVLGPVQPMPKDVRDALDWAQTIVDLSNSHA